MKCFSEIGNEASENLKQSKEVTHFRRSGRARSLANGSDFLGRDGDGLGVVDVVQGLDFVEHELAFRLTNLEFELAKLVEKLLEDLQVKFLIASKDNDVIDDGTHRIIQRSNDFVDSKDNFCN